MTRPQIHFSGRTVAITWDDGYDNLGGVSNPMQGDLRRSLDGGKTWEPIQYMKDSSGPIEQLTVAFGIDNHALLVWRQTEKDVVRFRTSNDAGATWGEASAVPDIVARPYLSKHQFDRYALAADSAGRFHLLAVGQVGGQDDLALLHLEMAGDTWSAPQIVYHGGGLPEYPGIATDGGNRLVVTFFVRDTMFTVGDYRVWQAYGNTRSPAVAPRPVPTFMPTAAPVRQTAAPPLDSPVATLAPGTITLEQRPSVGNPTGIVSLGGSIYTVIGLVLLSMIVRLWYLRHL
jgi:hypothetical protein